MADVAAGNLAPTPPVPLPPASCAGPELYHVGTLTYTKIGLVMAFFWLLWGDFMFSLMESVLGPFLSLKLPQLGASNLATSIIMTTIPCALNFMVNPVVSFRSDRLRTVWGRRIPILFWATPPVALTLVVMAFAPDIGQWVHAHVIGAGSTTTVATVVVATIGVVVLMFQFFNMFVASVYYYLFNDVVPEHLVARFLGLFRIVGTGAGMVYNWFAFPHALTHMRLIFLVAAAVYFVGFIMMCWGIKEGKYPPPPPLVGNKKGFIASVKTYFKECYSHPFYLATFGFTSFRQAAGACFFLSNVFFLSLGITMNQLGHFGTIMLIPALVLSYPIGWLCDRFHPLRIVFWTALLMPIISLVNFFVIHDFRTMVIMSVVSFPDGIFNSIAIFPMSMMLWPKDRFGQFGSADAVARSALAIGMSIVAGLFMDFMKKVYGGNQEYYRWMYIWAVFFQCISFGFILYVYFYWRKHGGTKNFVPPAV